MLKAVKVRIYPTNSLQAHLAQAFDCVRWVWTQSLAMMTATYQETGKGVTAMTVKKSIPLWKAEFEWLSECYSQCLQQSVLNLGVAFGDFFDGRAMYPTFKKRQGKTIYSIPSKCPYCKQQHDRDINAAINIKNEGLHVLTLGTSVIAPEGYVRPKQYRRKSTIMAAVVVEERSQHSIA